MYAVVRFPCKQTSLAISFLASALVVVMDLTSCLLTHSPRCGVRVLKDEKCIHMDSCPCGSRWCYLCGKEGCPRNGGGCDEDGESTVMRADSASGTKQCRILLMSSRGLLFRHLSAQPSWLEQLQHRFGVTGHWRPK